MSAQGEPDEYVRASDEDVPPKPTAHAAEAPQHPAAGARAPVADDEEPDPGAPPTGTAPFPCDLCGATMIDLHCKLVCPRCGYKRDCTDP